MPSVQRGSVVKRGTWWQARWYDEHGGRQARGGFKTKSDARKWLDTTVEEVTALRRGDLAAVSRRQMPTLGELFEEFIGQHAAEDSTLDSLRKRIRYALDGPKLDGQGGWRNLPIDRLQPHEIGAWRKRLPERSAFGIVKTLRQVLHYAVRAKLLDENPAALIVNPEPKRTEVPTFELAELDAVASELRPGYSAIPIFAAVTGLRPCEWIALERRDVDRAAGVVTVRREYVDGKVKPYGKTSRSLRAVPLPLRAAQALAEHPARVDTPLLFPAPRGGHIDLQMWRWREWYPALLAADVPKRVPYALRHTYASLSIAAGVSLFELSRFMGTSPQMIDKTYGHLLPDALDRTRAALDAFLCPIGAQTSGTAVTVAGGGADE
jgi:integrase